MSTSLMTTTEKAGYDTHVASTANPHSTTAAQIGTGSLHGTSNQPGVYRWNPANEAARFALSVVSGDKGKVAWQQDDNSHWVLIDNANVGNVNGWFCIGTATAVGPTYTTTFTSTSATSAVVQNIALADDTAYTINVICWARDTGVLYYLKKSVTEWRRGSGGGATQVGSDDGGTGTDQITVTGLTVVANSNGVDVKYGGSGSVHTRGFVQIYVLSSGLAVAT